jgi:hypothetical protein
MKPSLWGVGAVFFLLSCNSYYVNQEYHPFKLDKKAGLSAAYSRIGCSDEIKGVDRNQIDSIFFSSISEKMYLLPLDTFHYLMAGIYDPETGETPIGQSLQKLKQFNIRYLFFPEVFFSYDHLIQSKSESRFSKYDGFRSTFDCTVKKKSHVFMRTDVLFLDFLNGVHVQRFIGSFENMADENESNLQSWQLQVKANRNAINFLTKDFREQFLEWLKMEPSKNVGTEKDSLGK